VIDPLPRPPLEPPPSGPSTADLGDQAQLLRVAAWFAPACFVILTALWVWLCSIQHVLPGWLLPPLIILNVPLTVAGVLLVYRGTHATAVGFTRTVFAAGDIPPPRSYPRQDVLIVRGQFAEAAEYFRDHLTIEPDDVDARLRLAGLLETHLADGAGAEREYLEVRRRAVDARHEMMAANGLIDVYRRAGNRGRLMVELARFAERYRASAAGAAAGRELSELKVEERA
jgi:hypothetical protein